MDAMIILCVILFWFTIVLMLSHQAAYMKQKRLLLDHVSEVTYTDAFGKKKIKKSKRASIIQKTLKYADEFSDLGERINFFSENEDVAVWLKKSGNVFQLSVAQFQGLKIFLMVAGFFASVLGFIIGLPFSQYGLIFLPLAGYFTPIIIVRAQAKQRQENLRLDLPDFLDTISTSLQAGVSLNQALKEVIRFFDGPLREEFSRFLYEIDLGVPRETAYRNLLDRNDNREFQSLIKGLIQGERLGVPIATTFKIQADALRQIREEQIKELAAKASPKVTLVTTFVVAPVSILMIAGLMVLNLIFGENSIFNILN
ncbi:type II secretion system F family protein [Siminovitchia acidinfaciens]|uniref:Type II secretion system F family protein n=1 Tax=Siminovitchia acidinfaciens TaxID=2321395 RepID=A0A429XU22_9BACI|nr:type II secretion system F family protein [Siminovitchia acidinfaciens]RST71488.1 type II secretion system F family protein [Siminovitchia acidinfaciens]